MGRAAPNVGRGHSVCDGAGAFSSDALPAMCPPRVGLRAAAQARPRRSRRPSAGLDACGGKASDTAHAETAVAARARRRRSSAVALGPLARAYRVDLIHWPCASGARETQGRGGFSSRRARPRARPRQVHASPSEGLCAGADLGGQKRAAQPRRALGCEASVVSAAAGALSTSQCQASGGCGEWTNMRPICTTLGPPHRVCVFGSVALRP